MFVFASSYFLQWDFSVVASDSISIVSIALAIYTISISALIGSNFATILKNTQHTILKDCTQLDVIINYFRWATKTAILTILLSLLIQLKNEHMVLWIHRIKFLQNINLGRIYSSLCFACLALNFVFIWVIFEFIINRQLENE